MDVRRFVYGECGDLVCDVECPDGQKRVWKKLRMKEEVEGRSWVDGIGFESGVDVLKGPWVEEENALAVAVRNWDDLIRSRD